MIAHEQAIRFLSLAELATEITGTPVTARAMLAVGPGLAVAASDLGLVEYGAVEPSDAPTVAPPRGVVTVRADAAE